MSVGALPDARAPLSPENAEAAFAAIFDGAVTDEELTAFLIDMAERGESVDEVVAAARALRARMIPVEAPPGAIDVCGTGGDGRGSLNVSTAVAIVVAACGVPVAKHGNRAASSRSGAADVLRELGLDLDRPPAHAEATLAELGIAFLFAANHHPAMARVAGVRRALGRRTIFNLLGPLANPAEVKRQLVGVASDELVLDMLSALMRLGAEAAMVVHGMDGLDELSVCAPNMVAYSGPYPYTRDIAALSAAERANAVPSNDEMDGPLRMVWTIGGAEVGIDQYPPSAIDGGDAPYNAAALTRFLAGEAGAYRDIVRLNAAAALLVAGEAKKWPLGLALATEAIDSGAARDLLARWIAFA